MAAELNLSDHKGIDPPADWNSRDNAVTRVIRPKTATAKDQYVETPIRWAFYLFIATIPFETINLGIPIEITAISLGILFLTLILQPQLVFRRAPAAYLCFFAYFIVFTAQILLNPTVDEFRSQWVLVVVTQLILMSWVAFNLMRSERVARYALLTLALACLAMTILQLSGLASTAAGSRAGRVSALGFHPNNLARILSLGLLCLVGLAYGQRKSLIRPLYLVWGAIVLIGVSVVQTGSRGGLLALGAGVMVFAMRKGTIAVRIRNLFLVAASIAFFAFIALESENTKQRFEEALDEGDLARRQQIYPTAWAMFNEKPLTGWGPVTAEYELGTRLANEDETSKNAHNMLLQAMITTGLLGSIPLFIGTALAFLGAWKARNGPRGVMPLALITTVIVANMSGNWLGNKLHWLVLAYAVSSGITFVGAKVSHGRLSRTDHMITEPLLSN
jgi:O-antigen ligase